MPDIANDELMRMRGKAVYSADGQKVGGLETIYYGEETNRPEWLGLGSSGMFGSKHLAVPVSGMEIERDSIRVPYPKAQVTHSPAVAGQRISPSAEAELSRHYGLYSGADTEPMNGRGGGREMESAAPGTRSAEGFRTPPAEDRMTPQDARAEPSRMGGQTRPDERETMTLREERLRVGKRDVTTAVRMRKYVDVAPVSQDVELRKETARIERVPINRAVGPDEFREQQVAIELHEEMPTVTKEVIATEEIRLHRETHTEHQRVTAEVRRERVEIEGEDAPQSRKQGR